ncbi:MAG TPA: class IV adenylate cyclase [Stenomitos sp.]
MEKRGLEIETKFRLRQGQREAIAQALAGAPHHALDQEDRYFDAPGRVLRLRHEGSEWVLTRKDAPTIRPDGTKVRTEIETPVPTEFVGPLAETFAWLGHGPLLTVRKRRDEYTVDGVTICLDRIEGLTDDYVELEVLASDASAAERLGDFRGRFGLTDGQIETRSYARILADQAQGP